MRQLRIQAGGTVPADGYLYVEREQDKAIANIVRDEGWFTVAGARTMGKSSLIVRTQGRQAADETLRFALVDVAGDIGTTCATPREWLVRLGARLASRLQIQQREVVAAIPDEGTCGPLVMLQRMIMDSILAKAEGPLAIILDESDCLSSLPFKNDIIAAFRGLHAERARDERLQRLIVGLVGLRPIHTYADPLTGAGSPFGESIFMDDFPEDEATNERIAEALPAEEMKDRTGIASSIVQKTGGQPLLTMTLAKRAIQSGVRTRDEAIALITGFQEEVRHRAPEMFIQIERIILEHRMDSFAALSTYLGLLEGDRQAHQTDAPGADVLLTSGLVRVRTGKLEVKCDVFRDHFDRLWAEHTLSRLGSRENLYPRASFGALRHKIASEKRICVFNTGGTVGMVQKGEKVEPPDSPEEFMDHYGEIREIADIEFVALFNLDSANVYPAEWVRIARAIYDRRNDGYAGFVVAHGTDTMAFTAAAVAFALGSNLNFPVVFTGAQTTPDVKHGDARINLYRACLAATLAIPEVVICFGDFIFRAVRAQKKDERRFNGFESPVYPPLAHISERITVERPFVRAHEATKRRITSIGGAFNIDADRVRKAPEPDADIDLQASFASGVLQIALNPGLEPSLFETALETHEPTGERVCQGVILQTLGAGTVPSRGELAFVPFIERTTRLGIPVFISSQFPSFVSADSADDRFLSAEAPLKAGGIHVGNMTSAAAAVKVRWAIAKVDHEMSQPKWRAAQRRARLVEIMSTDYVGEVDL